jgi:glycosyltransferase involved in cell wall biosynthesis
MYKFSVITPVHLWNDYRVEMFLKTFESLKNQSFKNFEWVVVNDGSTMPFRWAMLEESGMNVKIIHKGHEERVIAYNEAFKEAEGEWFMLLDSDDEYKSNTLERIAKLMKKYPKDKMFNFGCLYQHKDGNIAFRDPFTPKRKQIGHVMFGGGNIVNGTFMFHRSVYEDMGAYPESHIKDIDCTEINYPQGGDQFVRDLYMGTPYDFSAAAQLQYPEIREYFMVNHEDEPNKVIKELGNPWGQDYYLFYKFTRKYHSRVFKEYLYIVNPR